MDARIIPGQENNEKQSLASFIDLLGKFDNNTEEFTQFKDLLMSSDISVETFLNLLGNNLTETIIKREIVNLPIQLLSKDAVVPTYSNITDACADLYASKTINIPAGETVCVNTDIALAIPNGYVCHIYPRSGLSVKTPLRLANSVGVIDAGYRDEIKVPLWNSGKEDYLIKKGMRIAQLDIVPSPAMEFYSVENVKDYGEDRGGGFGHSGLFEMPEDESNG